MLAHPALMVGSDSIQLYEGEGDRPGKPHPRTYGTFPRVLGEYARERRLFSLETAVHKMTGATARALRLRDHGLLREGYRADVAIFDPADFKDRATYADPHQYPSGKRTTVMLDSGIRSGTDVVRAYALGAQAAFAGKAFLWGLGALGEEGPGHVIDLLIEETQAALGQLGALRPEQAREAVIRHDAALQF